MSSLLKWVKTNRLTLGFLLPGVAILLFIAVPLIKVVFGVSPAELFNTLFDETAINAIWLTLYAALISTAIGFLLGVPLAYLLARRNFPGRRLVEGLINLPIVVPHSAAGIALLFVFGRGYIGGDAFGALGIDFMDSLGGIVVAMMFVSVPFLIESSKEGFKKVDIKLENVARSLGASPWQAFYRVTLPIAKRSIFSGGLLMWARGISEFGAVVIIAYHPMIAPVLIWERFQTQGLDYALPVAAILILISLIVFIALRMLVAGAKEND